MSTRGTTKGSRPPAKGTVKTPGKDQIKGEKPTTNILEIVPGKFNETDWLALLENDETEDFIADIYDDIWKETSKQIQQIYLHRQLLPYTLMTTENALTSVIQWAFLERDEPEPVDGDFWMDDDEAIPCSMDNWGEGVVPACREIQPPIIEEPPISVTERSPSPPINIQTPEGLDEIQRPSSEISSQSKTPFTEQYREEQSVKSDHTSSTKKLHRRSSFEQKPYKHDILVIETQPPKLEPLSDLFYASQTQTGSSTPYPTKIKRRHTMALKASSQLGSDAYASTTNITETTKSTKKIESKLFDDQHIEDIISKAPVAAQSMLKSILSRPPGYRELELDDYGNVIAIAKLDPDRLAPRSVRVKCDILKPRKSMIEPRTVPKHSQSLKLTRSDPKFAPIKLTLPERSTNVGDLIQPVSGVLYEDSRIKKGDPRRYRTGMSKYTNFYDESRPLKPITRRGDFTLLQTANDLLRISKDYHDDNDNEQDSNIPKLHRLARIPPIMSPSNTSSV